MYQQSIRERLAETGHIGQYDPRHIEAYMRLGHGTLDSLSSRQFDKEIEIARECIDYGGNDSAEWLAQSFGL